MGPVETRIRRLLIDRFSPIRLDVFNESHQHGVPAHSETHFRLLVVADAFSGLSRVSRGRAVHEALAGELKDGVHALTMRTFDAGEWIACGGVDDAVSPPCHGGSAKKQDSRD